MNYFRKTPFLFLLIAGSVLSCVARAWFGNASALHGSVVAMSICLICLIAYYLQVKRDNSGLHNPDNCYYMGLLFTLVSLIYSLITLFLLGGGTDDVSERTYNLIGSFGIALISTFFGILFRILLLQNKRLLNKHVSTQGFETTNTTGTLGQDEWPEQSELQPHTDLAEAAFKLRMELTQTIADMNVFRCTIVQASEETVTEVSKACTKMTQQVEKGAREQLEILSKSSIATVTQLTDTAKDMKKPLSDLVTSQTEQVENIRDLSEKITSSGEKLVTSIESVLEPLQNMIRSLQSTNQGVQEIFSNYNSLNSRLQQSVTFFTKVENEMEESAKALNSATERFIRCLSEATEVTPQYTQQFQELITALRGEAGRWQSMTTEVRTSLVQAIKKLTEAIKGSP